METGGNVMSDNVHEYRVCPRCDRELPLTEEFWYQHTINSLIIYANAPFIRECLDCKREYNNKRVRDQYANDQGYRKLNNMQRLLRYHRKVGNTARVAELEAELAALKGEKS